MNEWRTITRKERAAIVQINGGLTLTPADGVLDRLERLGLIEYAHIEKPIQGWEGFKNPPMWTADKWVLTPEGKRLFATRHDRRVTEKLRLIKD